MTEDRPCASEMSDHPPAGTLYVCGFAFHHDCVALRIKNKPKWQWGMVNGIGGRMEATDAGVRAAMCREFLEEAEIGTEPSDWTLFLDMRVRVYNIVVFFLKAEMRDPFDAQNFVTHMLGMQRFERTGQETNIVVPIRRLWDPSLAPFLIPNLRWLIPMCREQLAWPVRIVDERDYGRWGP